MTAATVQRMTGSPWRPPWRGRQLTHGSEIRGARLCLAGPGAASLRANRAPSIANHHGEGRFRGVGKVVRETSV